MTGFQKQVGLQQAPAVEGDFASANPRASALTGEGGFVAGTSGVRVGRFAWCDALGIILNNFGSYLNSKPTGFVHRNMNALITTYLAESGMVVPAGFPVAALNAGDFWAVNSGPGAVKIGDPVFTSFADGALYSALPAGTTGTGEMGATNTASLGATFTATGTGDSLAVTALTGYLGIGDTVTGVGVPIGTTILSQSSGTAGAAGTYKTSAATTITAATATSYGKNSFAITVTSGYVGIGDNVTGAGGFPIGATITAQISGTANGVGVYSLSSPGSAYTASATGVTNFGDNLKVTAASGVFAVGDPVTGTGIPAGVIASQVSGTAGGVGVYKFNARAAAYAASTALTVVAGIQTSFNFRSPAAVGELAQISTWG